MKCLITGITGQLGYDIKRELELRGYDDIIALSREELDLTNLNNIRNIIVSIHPDVIFHCAAYTAVDKAEDEKELCNIINSLATKEIAYSCKEIDSKLIYISTDYVFDGLKDGEYYPNDIVNPVNVYGKSKCMGEVYANINPKTYIARTSWVFGINGRNFVKTMLNLAKDKTEINVVSDQIGSPTYTVDLAKMLVDMAETDKYGIYHTTNEGFCSWADLAEYVFISNGLDITVNRISSSSYPQKAKRPLNSKLNKDSLEENFYRLPDWHSAINRFNLELKQEKTLRK